MRPYPNRRAFLSIGAGALLTASRCASRRAERPNILFALSDDVSWCHAGAYGDHVVQTPVFDRVAREGVLFTQSYCASPSCTPSRSSILTGQQMWRLEEGGLLFGTLPAKFDVFPLMLEQAGYHVGYTGDKGWGPGDYTAGGRTRDPFGTAYNSRRTGAINVDPKLDAAAGGISTLDYAANFRDFLAARPPGRPFFFFFSAGEPHRPYRKGSGVASGKRIEDVQVPPFLPDSEEIRGDILDYYVEVEWFDSHCGSMMRSIEEAGELDNTLVVMTSDNGMPFPRAKTTLYDWGVRMPLAVRWPARVSGGRVVDDFVSHTDFAPTFLELSGLSAAPGTTGRSLVSLLTAAGGGFVDPARQRVFTGIERHTWCRPHGLPYPSRMIRDHRFLYVHNYEPDRWPAGDPDFDSPHQGFYGDVDNSPTKSFMIANAGRYPREFRLAFGKRPAEELYDVDADPGQMNNLAASPEHADTRSRLRADLDAYLAETADPRSHGQSPWDHYPYYFGDLDPRRHR